MSEGTIRKLRLNFIRSAMVTMVSVMLGISGLIFLTNAWLTRQTIRNILDYLIENDGRIIPAETMNNGEEIYDYSILHFLGEMINNEDSSLYKSPEFRFTTRYFAVKFDADEKLVDILDNHIASVTEEEAEHYIWNTGNHVLYMAQPYYSGDELIARGVKMTCQSVEDGGKGLSYNVYLFNVTPGAEINYRNGVVTTSEQAAQDARLYVINTRSGVFHYPSCEGAQSIYKKNRKEVTATRKELTDQGYIPCGYCEP